MNFGNIITNLQAVITDRTKVWLRLPGLMQKYIVLTLPVERVYGDMRLQTNTMVSFNHSKKITHS